MNSIIEQIYATESVEDAFGTKYGYGPSSIPFDVGALLYDFVRAVRPERTLEIGLAYGLSTLFICQALRDSGAGSHTAIDPNEQTKFRSIGLLNLERAGLRDLLRFYEGRSDAVLPQLCAQQERFDFAFIDGAHWFDSVLVDFYFVDRLLEVGGHIVFDDLWMPGVRQAVSFVLRNRAYTLLRPPTRRGTRFRRRLLRTGRRIVQNPFGRDWPLKLVPERVACFQKNEEDQRRWGFHRAF